MLFERVKRIRFAHCDPAGIVFYPRYAELINELVEDWFAEGLGVDFRALMAEHRLGAPVVRMECDFLAPARLGDQLDFHLAVAEIRDSSVRLTIEAARGTTPCLRAALTIVLVSMERFRAVPIDASWRSKFEAYQADPARNPGPLAVSAAPSPAHADAVRTGATTHAPPSAWRIWCAAIRPRTLPLAVAPVAVGTALAWAAGAPPAWGVAVAALLVALWLQIGVNLHNDAADFERGNDQADRRGPLRATAAGWISASRMRRVAACVFALAVLSGLYPVAVGGWFILAIGSAALVAATAYSGGPWPISYTPLGELFVWMFFGLLAVAGSYRLQAGGVGPEAWLAGAMLGLPAAAVLLVNNLRDHDADVRAGRRTLAAVLGEAGSRRVYALLMLLPYAAVPLLAASTGRRGIWLALAALPFSFILAGRMLAGATDRALNRQLANTAQVTLGFAVLLALGALC